MGETAILRKINLGRVLAHNADVRHLTLSRLASGCMLAHPRAQIQVRQRSFNSFAFDVIIGVEVWPQPKHEARCGELASSFLVPSPYMCPSSEK